MSGHRKSPTDRSALTNWRWQSEGLVRTRKESDRVTPTHFLETAGRGTCQDTESTRPSEAHSQPGDGRGRDLSQHGKKPIHGGALTCCRRQRGALVRTRKETERAMPTHCLEIVEGETCQDIERNRPSEVHSQLSGDGRGRDLSGRGKKPTE